MEKKVLVFQRRLWKVLGALQGGMTNKRPCSDGVHSALWYVHATADERSMMSSVLVVIAKSVVTPTVNLTPSASTCA